MQKLNAADPETKSPDLAAENLAALRALFPELVTEGPDGVAVNLDVLMQLVGDRTVTDAEEKYGLIWHGTRRARQMALTPSTGTLRPCPEDSVDWDSTQNLMIEGDNLEVLKLLQKSYAGKVKLIYIDPPYNTGKDFVYPDNFQDNIKNYLELTGQTGVEGRKLSSNTEVSGRFHTDWLNMMYPRLKLARNLLTEDGVMFISIADHEIHNLRSVMDDIFGSENFIATVIWEKKYGPKSDAKHFSESHDFVLVFAKNVAAIEIFRLPKTEKQTDRYTNPDNDPRGPWKAGDVLRNEPRDYAIFPVRLPSGRDVMPPPNTSWRFTREKFSELIEDNRIWFGKDGDSRPAYKRFISEVSDTIPAETIWKHEDAGHNDGATKELRSLFDGHAPFDTPKPTRLLELMLKVGTASASGDIVMDFFAGSGSFGDAVMSRNVSDGGKRRYIVVQLPESLDSEEKDQKVAAEYCDRLSKPSNIAELTKERLRRAGKKIREENPLFAGDFGFRVFKLASSNIRAWDPDRDKIAETLEASIEHLKTDRTEQDILFELLLKLGLDLCVPIETKKIEGSAKQFHDLHSIGAGSLLVCLSQSIPQVDVEPLALALVAWHQELKPAGDTTVVFRDSAVADDVAKTNITAILQQNGLETVRSL
jgi:adenine-specific DNA-methyltransferase